MPDERSLPERLDRYADRLHRAHAWQRFVRGVLGVAAVAIIDAWATPRPGTYVGAAAGFAVVWLWERR